MAMVLKGGFPETRRGFTLAELLVVITIISFLAAIAATGLSSAREKARQTSCMSNLRQIGVAIVTYRGDHSGRNPNWISNLYPDYIDDLSVYVCRSDKEKGHGAVRPKEMLNKWDPGGDAYTETIDNDSVGRGGGDTAQNDDVASNSYMYEFSSAKCKWSVPGIDGPTWAQYKEYELRQGNDGKPHSSSKMPIVRCFHHAEHSTMYQYPEKGSSGAANKNDRAEKTGLTINVAYAGNVTIAPLWWQGLVEVGDK